MTATPQHLDVCALLHGAACDCDLEVRLKAAVHYTLAELIDAGAAAAFDGEATTLSRLLDLQQAYHCLTKGCADR